MAFGKHLEYFFTMLVISNSQYLVKNINLSPQNSTLDLIPIFRDTLNSVLFAEYVKKELVPILKNGDVFILDNSSVHKAKGVMKPLVELGVNIIGYL